MKTKNYLNNMQETELELEPFGLMQQIPGMQNVKMTAEQSDINETLKLYISGLMPNERITEVKDTVWFKYPATWLHMLKFQYFPQWLVKMFPIRYKWERKEMRVEFRAGYPKLPIAFPEQKNKIHYFTKQTHTND